MTARSSLFSANPRKAAVSSAITPSLKALRTSGRFSQTSATWALGRRMSSVVISESFVTTVSPDRGRIAPGGRWLEGGPVFDDVGNQLAIEAEQRVGKEAVLAMRDLDRR